jgi:hypothetical protein
MKKKLNKRKVSRTQRYWVLVVAKPNTKRKEIQSNPTSNKKKIIITQLLYNIKKVSSIYFLFTV